MNFLEEAEDFVVHKAVGRAAVAVAQAGASYALAHAGILHSWGVTVSVDPNVLAGGIMGAGHFVGQLLATKFPKVFGFLK